MKCLSNDQQGGEPLPDWEIHLRDSFGRPEEPVGGVTGVQTAEAALGAFLLAFPELSWCSLVAVRSSIAPPWSMYEGA